MGKQFKCHKISEGVAEAEVIISKDDIMFYLIEPETGKLVEPAHVKEVLLYKLMDYISLIKKGMLQRP